MLVFPSPLIPVATKAVPLHTTEVPNPPVNGPGIEDHVIPSGLLAIVFVFVESLPTRIHTLPFQTTSPYPDGF